MKKLLITILFLTSLQSYAGKSDDLFVMPSKNEIISLGLFCTETSKASLKNGLYYESNQEQLFTGQNLCAYSSNKKYHSKGNLLNGLRNGVWIYWYENGHIKSEEVYINGEKDGKWITWYENGQIQSEGFYINGKKNGNWMTWYEHDQQRKKSEGNYINGSKSGLWTSWSEKGVRKKQENFDTERCWYGQYWNLVEDDKLTFKNQLYTGSMICKHNNGKIAEKGFLLDGKSVGIWNRWNTDGDMISETNYKENKLDGNAWWFDDNLNLMTAVFKEGKCVSGDCP